MFIAFGMIIFPAIHAIATDYDTDGIPDNDYGIRCRAGNTIACDDNCPIQHNPLQEDTDGDTVGDICDNCPLVDNLKQGDWNEDGVGNMCQDSDLDGVYDTSFLAADNCRGVINPMQEDVDADTVGDACDNCPDIKNPDQTDSTDPSNGFGDACDTGDSDGDTIADNVDNCPAINNTGQENEDGDRFGDICDPAPSIVSVDGLWLTIYGPMEYFGCDNEAYNTGFLTIPLTTMPMYQGDDRVFDVSTLGNFDFSGYGYGSINPDGKSITINGYATFPNGVDKSVGISASMDITGNGLGTETDEIFGTLTFEEGAVTCQTRILWLVNEFYGRPISSPTPNDSDGDGCSDTVETAFGLDPYDDDSDDDGIFDCATGGEDLNNNGLVDPGESDPRKFDTDADGLSDGVERGLTEPEGSHTDMNKFIADADPTTQTSATSADSDGDGISDGTEDTDKDGEVDEGESDPNEADQDNDMDGYSIWEDCNDYDGSVNPGAIEICNNGTDDDCDDLTDSADPYCQSCQDIDEDGYGDPVSGGCTHLDLDCNDSDGDVNPGMTEIKGNQIDENCDGIIEPGEGPCFISAIAF